MENEPRGISAGQMSSPVSGALQALIEATERIERCLGTNNVPQTPTKEPLTKLDGIVSIIEMVNGRLMRCGEELTKI